MTLFLPDPKGSHKNSYGYLASGDVKLDVLKGRWAGFEHKPWRRPFEVMAKPHVACTCVSSEFREDFHRISRNAFRYIAERHVLTPFQMWTRVENGLRAVGMHEDDVEFVQSFIFGWVCISAEQMERFRWRYPERCPLLDVLCTLDDTYEELNLYQDKMLELKGSKGRRRLDVIPPLPATDGVRQPKRERVAGSISFTDLLDKDRS